MGPIQAVRRAFEHHQPAALDRLMCALGRGGERHNPVGIAVNDQRGHVDGGEIFPEIRQPRRYAVQRAFGRGAGRDVPTGLYDLVADELAAQDVHVVEIREELGEKP